MPKDIEIFTKITGSFNLLLLVSSCLLNPIVFFICVKSKRLRSTSTFKLLAIGAINDFICCIPWNQEAFTNSFFDFQSPYRSWFYCTWISIFLQFTSFELASWLLVTISLDRFLSVTWKKWSKSYFSGLKPIIFALILALVIMGINFNQVFHGAYSYVEDGIEMIICYENAPDDFPWYLTMSQVLLYFGYIVPYALIVVFNSLIIYEATRFQRSQRIAAASTASTSNSRRKTEMTKTVFTITALYILTSLPDTVIAGYYYLTIISYETGQMIINIVNGLQSTYQAFNFFVLIFSNKIFAQEVRELLKHLTRNFEPVTVTNTNTNTSLPERQQNLDGSTQMMKSLKNKGSKTTGNS